MLSFSKIFNTKHLFDGNEKTMSQQYVYSMLRVSKVVPPQKTIIKDISLSFPSNKFQTAHFNLLPQYLLVQMPSENRNKHQNIPAREQGCTAAKNHY
jgi:hypothetical protein